MKVRILTTQSGEEIEAGTLELDGEDIQIEAEDGYESMLEDLLTQPIYLEDAELNVEDDPEAWLSNLPAQYNGAYLRAEIVDAE